MGGDQLKTYRFLWRTASFALALPRRTHASAQMETRRSPACMSNTLASRETVPYQRDCPWRRILSRSMRFPLSRDLCWPSVTDASSGERDNLDHGGESISLYTGATLILELVTLLTACCSCYKWDIRINPRHLW